MSKSVKRVRAALEAAGIAPDIREVHNARSAQDAADAIGCELDQIVKSIILRGTITGKTILFLTAGGNMVDTDKAGALAKEPLGKADAALVRTQTGFAIGGVAPVGHISPIPAFIDARLLDFDEIWAAAGTPRHVFSIRPEVLKQMTGNQVSDFTS